MVWTSSIPPTGRFPVIELAGRRCRDFMETAAIMTHLDLVITPDTARCPSGRRPGIAGLDRALHRGRVALARGTRRYAVVSHHAALSPDLPRRLGRSVSANDGCTEGRACAYRRRSRG